MIERIVNLLNKHAHRMVSLSSRNDDLPATSRLIKMMEEAGELAATYLAQIGARNKSKSALTSSVLEESVDLYSCAVDMLVAGVQKGYVQLEDVDAMFTKKMDKWERKLEGKE